MQGRSTNWEEVVKFLRLLREAEPTNEKIYLVADNHRAHYKYEVSKEAHGLNIEFIFMPAGTPEMNSIEALGSVIKRDFKSRLIQLKLVTVKQVQFSAIL